MGLAGEKRDSTGGGATFGVASASLLVMPVVLEDPEKDRGHASIMVSTIP